jgi:hypothetical protein
MADDVDLANPSGTAAADDIGSKLYQKIKAGHGADGTWRETDTGTPGNAFPVQLITPSGVPFAFGSGANGETVPRVALATDSPGVATLVETTLPVSVQPVTTGGVSVFKSLDLDETDEDVKASAGQVYWIYAVNRTTSPLYLRLYNTNTVTVGTTAHLAGPFEIPANASDHTVLFLQFPQGIPFSTAISAAVTTGFADNDAGAPGANHCMVNIGYK